MASTFLHSMVWNFQEPEELIIMFDNMVRDANVRCTYMFDTHMFRIEFPEPGHESSYFKFVDMCNAYIDKHQDGPADAMSDPKILRMAETGGTANAEDELEKLLREDDSVDGEHLIDVNDDRSSGRDEDEDKAFWNPKDPNTNIAVALPDRVLQDIAQDTACSLDLNVEKACVFITNATQNKIQAVVKKLDNVERNWHRLRIDTHFMRTEKESDSRLRLHRLQHLGDGTLLQTLAPLKMKDMLPRQRVVRLMRHNDKGVLEVFTQNPSKVAHDEGLVLRWTSIQLPRFLREGMHESLLELDENPVEVWLKDTHDYVPEGEGDDLMGGDTGATNYNALLPAAAPSRKQAEYPVQDLGFPEETDSESRSNSSLLIDYEGRMFERSQQANAGAIPPSQPVSTPAPDSVDGRITTSSILAEPLQSANPSGIKFTAKLPKASWDITPALPEPVEYCPSPLPDYAGDSHLEPFPSLESRGQRPRVQQVPPALRPSPGFTLVRPQGLPLPADKSGQYSQVTQATPEEATDVVETIQLEDEVSSRRYFQTTAHRKPKPKSKGKSGASSTIKAQLEVPEWDPRENQRIDKPSQSRASAPQVSQAPQPKPRILPDCSNDLLKILDSARAFRGHLDMEVSIGRILLEGLVGPEAKEFAEAKAMSSYRMVEGIEKYLLSDTKTYLHFVERLTSDTEEACQIPAAHLFKQDPTETEVDSWYEFDCEDKYHNDLIVKVKGMGKAETVFASLTIGQAFFHYPKRKWDARFAVEGRRQYTHRKAVSDFVEQLSADVRGSKDDQLVDVRFRVNNDLKIHTAYAKKRLSFTYLQNDRIKLHITEVQELIRGRMKTDTSIHQVASGKRSEMVEDHRLWFEAKLSISAESFFEQNLETSTGDDAAWTAKEVLDDKTMCDVQNIIDNVVTRMDGVGAKNKGRRGDEKDMQELEAWECEAKQKGHPGCW
ncbi:hypothetical protein D6C97_01858 [Aureobasidium pullulans]|nr:hypothetical protein D6C97_01858 [Aureobasidium pullulans]